MSDLLVIGPGELGHLVARKWRSLHPSSTVTLKYRSHNQERAAKDEKEGYNVVSGEGGEEVRCQNVLFSAPPTGNPDYGGDVLKGITDHWDKTGPASSCFIFTSAGSVYRENDGGTVDESSEIQRTERSGKLLDAEDHVVRAGGCAIRLGGLYTWNKGAHNYWSSGTEFPSKPRGLINLIHYDDAADLIIACLNRRADIAGQVFLASDGVPVSRQEIADTVTNLRGQERITFTGGDAVDGKRYCTDKVRKAVDWEPKFSNFKNFMENPSNVE